MIKGFSKNGEKGREALQTGHPLLFLYISKDSYSLRLLESITSVIRVRRQWTSMEYGAVWGWCGVGCIRHGYHSDAEVDPESVDHREAEEHHDGQVEADRAALGRNCSSKITINNICM